MIIAIYGKSGSGKSYLAEKMIEDITNSIHIDIDELNRDLMTTDGVKHKAKEIFGTHNVFVNNNLDTSLILKAIMNNDDIYNKWTSYMKSLCNNFITNYIANTNYNTYILDHLNAGTLDVCKDNYTVYIACELDKATRLQRLNLTDSVSEDILNFRDNKYISMPPTITYTNNNYHEILNYLNTTIKS